MKQHGCLNELLLDLKESDEKGIYFIKEKDQEKYISYKTLYNKSLTVCTYLKEKGIKTGQPMIFQISDIEKFIYCFWGCLLGGYVPVPVTSGTGKNIMEKLMKIWHITGESHIITSPEYGGKVLQSVELPEEKEKLKQSLIHIDMEIEPKENYICQSDAEDTAFIQFSSGSTGEPGGVTLTHRNLLANVAAINERFQTTEDDKALSWMPLTHDMGMIAAHIANVHAKMTHYIMPPQMFVRNPYLWLKTVSDQKVSVIYAPNFGYRYFLDFVSSNRMKELDLSALRLIVNGAEPIHIDLCLEFIEKLKDSNLRDCAMTTVYGLAEGTVGVTCPDVTKRFEYISLDRKKLSIGERVQECQSEGNAVKFAMVGHPFGSCKVRISHENKVLESDRVGEIEISGDSVTKGYYRNPEKNEVIFTEDGWLKTGDLGFIRDGQLVITGRMKDIIIINGVNYYAHDIEKSVEEAIGFSHGKVAAAPVKLKDSDVEQLAVFLVYRGKLPEFVPITKQIRAYIGESFGIEVNYIVPVNKIPKTTSGKIQRFQLKSELENGLYDEMIEELQAQEEEESIQNSNPLSEIEQKIMDMWIEVLGNREITVHSNFFEIGGNSVLLLKILSMLEEEFEGFTVDENVFEYSTIEKMAMKIKSDRSMDVEEQYCITLKNAYTVRQEEGMDENRKEQPLYKSNLYEGNVAMASLIYLLYQNMDGKQIYLHRYQEPNELLVKRYQVDDEMELEELYAQIKDTDTEGKFSMDEEHMYKKLRGKSAVLVIDKEIEHRADQKLLYYYDLIIELHEKGNRVTYDSNRITDGFIHNFTKEYDQMYQFLINREKVGI